MPELPDFPLRAASSPAWLLLLRTIVRLPREEKAASPLPIPDF